MAKRALVTGANGFVGTAVCKELLLHGYTVRAMHRPHSDCSSLVGLEVELHAADITDRASLEPACKDIDVIFHIAALFRQAKFPDSVYYDINVEGTRNVFDVGIAAGVDKIIHCSTVGVHSHIPKPPADESEPYRPGDIYQVTKCEGEKLALEYLKTGKIKGNIIRPAMIWGPGDSRTLKLFQGIARSKMPLIGTGRTLVHWVLVSDLARSFRLAAEVDSVNAEVFIIAGKRPVSMEHLFRTIATTYNVSPPRFKIPAWPVQLIGSLMELICRPLGVEPPIYRRRVDFFTKTRSFCSAKAHSLLGYHPEHDFEAEVNLIGQSYKDLGLI